MGDQPVVGLWFGTTTDPWECEPWLRDFCNLGRSWGDDPHPVVFVRGPSPLGLPGFDLTDVHSFDHQRPEAPEADEYLTDPPTEGLTVPPVRRAPLL